MATFTYNYTDEDFKVCQDFANEQQKSLYKFRGSSSQDKIISDIIVGKLGEIATYNFLKNHSNLTYPDFQQYSTKNKKFDYDLSCDDYNIHVKTQNILSSQRYETSWVFQVTDKKVFGKFDLKKDIISFNQVNLTSKEVKILKICLIEDLHKFNLFKPLKLAKYNNNNKIAIYYSDLEKTIKNDIL